MWSLCLLSASCHLCATVQDKKPGNAIEAAVLSIRDSLSQGGYAMSNVTAAEWWAHKRAATDAHQLHFDLDETRIGSGAAKFKLKHPVRCWSSHWCMSRSQYEFANLFLVMGAHHATQSRLAMHNMSHPCARCILSKSLLHAHAGLQHSSLSE